MSPRTEIATNPLLLNHRRFTVYAYRNILGGCIGRQIVHEYIVTLFGGIQRRNLCYRCRSPSRDSFMRGPLQHCRTVTVSGGCDLSGRKEFHSLLRSYLRPSRKPEVECHQSPRVCVTRDTILQRRYCHHCRCVYRFVVRHRFPANRRRNKSVFGYRRPRL